LTGSLILHVAPQKPALQRRDHERSIQFDNVRVIAPVGLFSERSDHSILRLGDDRLLPLLLTGQIMACICGRSKNRGSRFVEK
jgi:hypothetical protein